MTAWIDRLRCWWSGHEDLYVYTPGRVTLTCLRCGRESPGWTFDRPRPTPIGRPRA